MAYKKKNNFDRFETNENDLGVSKFNSSQLISFRLNNSFISCRRHWNNGNYEELNNELVVIWTELYADASKDQRKKYNEIEEAIGKYFKLMNESKSKSEHYRNRLLYINEIKWKWLFLKVVEKSQGLGKAYRDEFEDDFE